MKALIVIDPQNDFCPGGALAVAGGDEIMPRINAMMADFDLVVLTQDWHPAGHSSFASSHSGSDPVYRHRDALWPAGAVAGPLYSGK